MENEAKERELGLTSQEAEERAKQGLSNRTSLNSTKSIPAIIKENAFTIFNGLNFVLGIMIISMGAYKNALFLVTVIFNLSVGIINQIRAKKILDELSILSKLKVDTYRDGVLKKVDIEALVVGDVIVLDAGSQIPADLEILEGSVEADESLISGEADLIMKSVGDTLYSGTDVISGKCTAVITAAGDNSFSSGIIKESKYEKENSSDIMRALNWIIKTLTIYISVIGVLLILKQYFLLDLTWKESVLATASAVVGMIPEGLILLTNVALALGSMRLARRKVLVQELYSIETLARVGVLCLDKTGTITTGKLKLKEIITIDDSFNEKDLADMIYSVGDDNLTARAIKDRFRTRFNVPEVQDRVRFSSSRKWSGVSFGGEGMFVMGAPEVLLDSIDDRIKAVQAEGKRVLLFSRTDDLDANDSSHGRIMPLAYLIFDEELRKDIRETFGRFRESNIDVKIISGDSAETVYSLAREAGANIGEGHVNINGLSDEEVLKLAEENDVFGRVSPHQKKLLISSFKKDGTKVSMTGDGVNDVPALRESDCSISLINGSDAARAISDIVLMDSDLGEIYSTILEGNIVINNIQRSSTLFLLKTVFSCALSFLFLFIPGRYPFYPIQLTLISALFIGLPSFMMTFYRKYGQIEKDFLFSILYKALPGGASIAIYCLISYFTGMYWGLDENTLSTLVTYSVALSMAYNLLMTLRPLDLGRALLFTGVTGAYVLSAILFKDLFMLQPLPVKAYLLLLGEAAVLHFFYRIMQKVIIIIRKRIFRKD